MFNAKIKDGTTMSDQKIEKPWNAETARAERKERLSKMKDKNGGKKPIKFGSPVVRIVIAIVLVVAVILSGGWYTLNSGLPQQQLAAMTINGDGIKVVELNYYYYMIASNFGVDFTDKAKAEETLNGPSNVEGFATLKDYILDTAAKAVQENYLLAAEGTKAGLTLSDASKTQITDFFTSLQSSADSAKLSLTNYMAQYFGKGASKASLTPAFERLLLANQYADQKKTELTVSDADIKAYYDQHKDEFDIISYRKFEFAATIADGATDAEKTKALEDAKAKANAMVTLVTDDESFKAQAIANATAETKDSYTNSDASLSADIRYSSVSSLPQATWLFDDTRVAGDKTVIDETTGSTVIYFIKRSIDNTQRVSVRHILIKADETTATDTEIAAAKTKAEGILAQFTAGAQTEDAFAALAKANSEDNAEAGGLYENIAPGQMVEAFNNWIFDPARKTGDTGIVQTNYGFHVMYFVNQAGEEWSINIRSVLIDEAYNKYLEEGKKTYTYEMNKLGLKFVP
jgi:hypothetical protein